MPRLPMSFLQWPPKRWEDSAKILQNLWGILCNATFDKKMTGSGQVTEICRHKWTDHRRVFHGQNMKRGRADQGKLESRARNSDLDHKRQIMG